MRKVKRRAMGVLVGVFYTYPEIERRNRTCVHIVRRSGEYFTKVGRSSSVCICTSSSRGNYSTCSNIQSCKTTINYGYIWDVSV